MSVIGTERSQMVSCSGNRARPDIERRHECQGSLVIESYYFLTKESKVMSVIGTEKSQMVSCSERDRARPDIERRHACQGSLVIESYYSKEKKGGFCHD